jgi:MFS family permease
MLGVSFGLNNMQIALLSVYLIVAIDMFGLTLVIPVSVTYSEYLGADKSKIGLLFTAFSVGAFLSSLVIGKISDRFGRRSLFLWTLSGALIGMTFIFNFPRFRMLLIFPFLQTAFIGSAFARSFLEFILWRGLAGIFTGTISNAMAYITDVVPHNLAPIYISYVTAVISSCFVIGPIIGGGLASFGIRVPFFAASFIAAWGLLMCFFYVKDVHTGKETTESTKKNDDNVLASAKYYQGNGKEEENGLPEEKLPILLKTTSSESSSVPPMLAATIKSNSTGSNNSTMSSTSLTSSKSTRNQKYIFPEPKDVSPFFNPWALLIGGVGTFLNTLTYTATAVLVPLFLMEPSYGIVTDGELKLSSAATMTPAESEKISLYVGYNLGAFGLIQALVMIYLFPLLNTKIGLLNTGAIGAIMNGMSFLFLEFSAREAHLLFIYMGMAIGNGLVRPSLPAFLGLIAPRSRHGEYIAVGQTFSNLSMIFAGSLTEIYIHHSKWEVILLAGGASLLNGLLMVSYELWMTYYYSALNEQKRKTKQEEMLAHRSNLEKFFGFGEQLKEDEFFETLVVALKQVIHLRGYDKAIQTRKGQQVMKELLLQSLPSLPDTFDDRMEAIYQLYQNLGHDEWAHDLAGKNENFLGHFISSLTFFF